MAKHMDRLSSVDASFLAQEREGSHMHIGSILLFEGPAPRPEEVIAHVESRLHLVPRYRHKLSFPRLEMGRPLWVDDPSFNVGYHVRHTALPAPGSVEQLRLLAGRIFSQRLDRSKPLWELWVVEGLEDGRFAVVNKTHHCLVDGVSGADLTAVMFDLEREGTSVPGPDRPWQPAPEPGDVDVATRGVTDLAGAPLGLARRAASVLGNPRRTVAQAREAAAGVGEVAWNAVVSAPDTPLNGPMGPHRRLTWVRLPLDDLKQIKRELGGTVNDVFLTVVSGALHRWLRTRGVVTDGLELRSAVPVSIRASGAEADLGNQITIMIGRLPTYVEDPVERHRLVVESMAHLKESKQAMGAEVIASLEDFAPPTDLRPGFAAALLDQDVQPADHQRAGPADPAVPAGTRDDRAGAGGLPGPWAAAGRGDDELQRLSRALADGRLRHHARPGTAGGVRPGRADGAGRRRARLHAGRRQVAAA